MEVENFSMRTRSTVKAHDSSTHEMAQAVFANDKPESVPSTLGICVRMGRFKATPFVTDEDPTHLELQAIDVTVRPISSSRAATFATALFQGGAWMHSALATVVHNPAGSRYPKKIIDGQNRNAGADHHSCGDMCCLVM